MLRNRCARCGHTVDSGTSAVLAAALGGVLAVLVAIVVALAVIK